ncbi:MAG: Phage derived protein Gp49-like [Solirubrobacteraceae bacterium]|jgi:phage-related protein|nr:Phage derived protein Gp49-like [Solirubrobacteraceae bacterium]MEA2359879.1 Phage derived protein Gp49-like [Solirubrobacteraceae bacterium]
MTRTQAVYYRDGKGLEPVDAFLNGLPAKAAAKIDDAIEEHLNGKAPGAPPPEFPHSSQIAGELRELRVRFASTRYRLLYQRSHNLLVLLHAIEKNTGTIPDAAENRAKERMADFKKRMDADPRAKPRAAGKDAPGSSRKGS